MKTHSKVRLTHKAFFINSDFRRYFLMIWQRKGHIKEVVFNKREAKALYKMLRAEFE